jgi:hypothetical protein
MYPLMTPRELLTVTSGFAVHQMGEGSFGYRILSRAGVFTAEPYALFTAIRHIAEIVRPPKKCLILTDSLSSIKVMLSRRIAHRTHPMVYECKQLCLFQNGIEVKLIGILPHVGLVGNELVDEQA